MADMEKREDQKISECLQSAFGYSDEQLLKQLDQADKKFKDVTFEGAEERLMERFMERKKELEKETSAKSPETATQKEEETGKTERLKEAAADEKGKKKVIRFGKKKILATAALVAVIGGMLGGTATGRRSYFFKRPEGIESVYLDNSNNNTEINRIKNVYDEIEDTLDIPALRLGYSPEGMKYVDFDTYKEGVQIRFLYKDNLLYFIQRKQGVNTASGINTDRVIKKNIFNKWLNQKIEYSVNKLEDGDECESIIIVNNNYYYLSGNIQEDEFKKILEYLYFS